MLETSDPPSYYFRHSDIVPAVLGRADGSSFCECKGAARYWDVGVDAVVLPRVGWSCPTSTVPFAALRDHVAFYARPFYRCSVGGETVVP